MKKILLIGLALTPLALFASEGAETDIIQRTVNFIIFAGILWYLLADKLKAYFAQRSLDVQSELEKVQDMLKESSKKVEDAQAKLDEAKKLSAEIRDNVEAEANSVKEKVAKSVLQEIANLNKNFDEKIKIESKKAKKEIVSQILEELLKSDNIKLSDDELANIVLKKVA